MRAQYRRLKFFATCPLEQGLILHDMIEGLQEIVQIKNVAFLEFLIVFFSSKQFGSLWHCGQRSCPSYKIIYLYKRERKRRHEFRRELTYPPWRYFQGVPVFFFTVCLHTSVLNSAKQS